MAVHGCMTSPCPICSSVQPMPSPYRTREAKPPFRVERDGDGWTLVMRPDRRIIWCDTQAEAIDYAYRHWPWYP